MNKNSKFYLDKSADGTLSWDGHTLYRVVYTEEFITKYTSNPKAKYTERDLRESDVYVQFVINIDDDNLSVVVGSVKIYGMARVYGNAQVYGLGGDTVIYGNAKIHGNAHIDGRFDISGKAEVYGNATIENSGTNMIVVYDNAKVYDKGALFDNAWVYGNGEVYDMGSVHGYGKVYGHGKVHGIAMVIDHGTVCDNGEIDNNVIVSDEGKVAGDAKVYGKVEVNGMTVVEGDKIIKTQDDLKSCPWHKGDRRPNNGVTEGAVVSLMDYIINEGKVNSVAATLTPAMYDIIHKEHEAIQDFCVFSDNRYFNRQLTERPIYSNVIYYIALKNPFYDQYKYSGTPKDVSRYGGAGGISAGGRQVVQLEKTKRFRTIGIGTKNETVILPELWEGGDSVEMYEDVYYSDGTSKRRAIDDSDVYINRKRMKEDVYEVTSKFTIKNGISPEDWYWVKGIGENPINKNGGVYDIEVSDRDRYNMCALWENKEMFNFVSDLLDEGITEHSSSSSAKAHNHYMGVKSSCKYGGFLNAMEKAPDELKNADKATDLYYFVVNNTRVIVNKTKGVYFITEFMNY